MSKGLRREIIGKETRGSGACRAGIHRKGIALLAAAVLLCGGQAGRAQAAEESTGETEEILREETVYAVQDASGEAKHTWVNVRLRNPEGLSELEDTADLTDIVNVKGEETWTTGDDGQLVWQADGNEITYRGTTDRELPVTMEITYELDGEEVTPEELAGADGHLTLRIAYTNHCTETVDIKGNDEEICVPFLALTGLALDGSKVSDVTVSGGRVVDNSEQIFVLAWALPGMAESLAQGDTLMQSSLESVLASEVVIEADVTDFSLLTIGTVLDNSLLQQNLTESPLMNYAMLLLGDEASAAVMTSLMTDSTGQIGRMQAMAALAREYRSFAGGPEDVPGSVRFILRTEGIEN